MGDLFGSKGSIEPTKTAKMAEATKKSVPFNGGKMNHIFKPGKGLYEDGFASDAAQRCFEDPESIATLKVHGECCILVKRPVSNTEDSQPLYEWIFCTRLDTKGKPYPENHVPVPVQTSESVQLQQPATFEKHTYCFVPLAKDHVVGKGGKKSRQGPDTYAAIRAGVDSGALPDPNDADTPDFLTVEWIGRKHQGNIDCLDVDHAITVHGSTVVDIERTREAVEKMAREVSIEGLVFQDRVTGERFKLRFDMLVKECLFEQNSKLKISTPDCTTIKPIVIQANLS